MPWRSSTAASASPGSCYHNRKARRDLPWVSPVSAAFQAPLPYLYLFSESRWPPHVLFGRPGSSAGWGARQKGQKGFGLIHTAGPTPTQGSVATAEEFFKDYALPNRPVLLPPGPDGFNLAALPIFLSHSLPRLCPYLLCKFSSYLSNCPGRVFFNRQAHKDSRSE